MSVCRFCGKGEVGPPRVLLIEDNAADQILQRVTLESLGCLVEIVPTAERGLAALRESIDPFDLVLLDIGLPGMRGMQAFHEIRKLTLKIPVVFVSAAISQLDIECAASLGHVSMIQKPLDETNLREVLFKHRIPFMELAT